MTTPDQPEIVQLGIGDTVPLGTVLANLILMGIVTDINNPNMFAATLEAFHDQAVLTVPVLQGPTGSPGQPSFALRWQNDNKTDPTQLPTDLTDLPGDLGKFWIFAILDSNGNTIATSMYVWWGTSVGFRQLPVGAPGPPGPYSVITPNIVLEIPGSGNGPGGVDSWIAVTGTVGSPTYTFHIAAPRGVAGPSALLSTCPDVNFTTKPPQPGDILACTSQTTSGGQKIWAPESPGGIIPQPYTVPESAFTSQSGVASSTVTVCTFDVPPQGFKWKPWVMGQMQIFGANISATPLLVGAEVRLGDPNSGTIVARGFGNSLGYVTLIPHASDTTNTSAAITPTNATGLVQANHSGNAGKLYVNLVNQGMAGVYDFHSTNAQLSVMILPVLSV